MPYVTEDTLGELDCKIDELNDAIDRLVKDNEALEQKVDGLEAERGRLRDTLEEILDQCKDEYDLDPDPTGGHRDVPNRWMRIGNMIEEALGRGGF